MCWLDGRGVDLGVQIVQFARTYLPLSIPEGLELPLQVAYCWRNWVPPGQVLIIIDDLTSSQPYKDGDSSPRPRGLATKRLESLIGVDSSTHTASKRSYIRSLSVLSLGMPSRDYMYRLDQKHQKILLFGFQVGFYHCPSVVSLLLAQSRFQLIMSVYRCKRMRVFQPLLS